MAKCDEGYLCEVCGDEVEGIAHSDLYLRFVIGELDPERLHTTAERHINCNPVLAQFIDAEEFQFTGDVPEGFETSQLDVAYVAERKTLITRGWRRLQELATTSDEMAIHDYPLPEAKAKWS